MAIFDLNSFIAKYVVKRPQSLLLKDIENNHETLNSKIRGKENSCNWGSRIDRCIIYQSDFAF